MAHFHITPGTPSLDLPPSRRGQFSFAVTNNLGRAVRIQASIHVDEESEAKWLSIDGAAQRDLAPTETETFLVQVQVPTNVPGGEHRFRLLVASVDHPDDEYDTSPEVAFTIPAVQPGSFPWWIAAAAGAILLIAVGGFLLFRALQRPGLREPCNPAKANCRGELACSLRDGGSVCLAELGAECRAGADCVTGVCEGSRDGGTGNVCGKACAPDAGVSCGSCGGTIQCDGTCSKSTPANYGQGCGKCGGTVQCDGTCSKSTPANYGQRCGNCGGTIQCDGSCSKSTPANYAMACGWCGGTIQCDGNCSKPTPSDLGKRCNCTGTVGCGGCSQKRPCDGTCAGDPPRCCEFPMKWCGASCRSECRPRRRAAPTVVGLRRRHPSRGRFSVLHRSRRVGRANAVTPAPQPALGG